MTYTAPSCDFYDDGLVHSHYWARNAATGKHADKVPAPVVHTSHDSDEGLVHDHHWARS